MIVCDLRIFLTRTESEPTLQPLGALPRQGIGTLYAKDLPDATNPAIQSVASASKENWIEESAYRQKDSDKNKNRLLPTHSGLTHSIVSTFAASRMEDELEREEEGWLSHALRQRYLIFGGDGDHIYHGGAVGNYRCTSIRQ